MHPVVIFIPAAVVIFGPRLWAKYVLKRHNREEENFPGTAGELAYVASSLVSVLSFWPWLGPGR